MGVAGSGKTSVGRALASRLGWDFYEADDFHPPGNIAKMTAGIPLEDEDRDPWLITLHDLITARLRQGSHGVLACSALKEGYRQTLRMGNPGLMFVYLRSDRGLIGSRLTERTDHYMKAGMLESQFEDLEEPVDGSREARASAILNRPFVAGASGFRPFTAVSS